MKLLRSVLTIVALGATATGAVAAPHPAPAPAPQKAPIVRAPVKAVRPLAEPVKQNDEGSLTVNDASEGSGPTGLTGLDNAIAHVSANLADHPNKGLQNALDHLQANKAKHEARQAAKLEAKSSKAKKHAGH